MKNKVLYRIISSLAILISVASCRPKNLSTINEKTINITENKTSQTTQMFVNSPEGLRLRDKPSIDSEKILLIPDKQKVIVLEQNDEPLKIDEITGNWYLLDVNGIKGWAFSGYLVNELITQNHAQNKEEMIEDFAIAEILNGKEYTASLRDPNGVISIYGKPLEDTIKIINPFNFEGSTIINFREIVYEDLTHTYYVTDKSTQIYAYVEVTKKVDRLKKINIGESVEKLVKTFGEGYYKDNNNIHYHGLQEDVIFIIKDNLISSIICYYLLI
jgi:hypothetical protein